MAALIAQVRQSLTQGFDFLVHARLQSGPVHALPRTSNIREHTQVRTLRIGDEQPDRSIARLWEYTRFQL